MLTLKLQVKDYKLTLLPPPHKIKSAKSKVKTKVFSKLNTLDLSLVGLFCTCAHVECWVHFFQKKFSKIFHRGIACHLENNIQNMYSHIFEPVSYKVIQKQITSNTHTAHTHTHRHKHRHTHTHTDIDTDIQTYNHSLVCLLGSASPISAWTHLAKLGSRFIFIGLF